jgi:predicted regulator of Ras-like GTPase activity (Roadblock/LC7/MglB family)
MTAQADVLATLRDVAGVHGSFMVSSEGRMVACDMAALFTDEILDEVAPRLLRLADAFGDEDVRVLSYVLRYQEHLLFVRGLRQGVLCVLSDSDVNMPALRMGASLAVRRLTSLAERGPELDPPRKESPAKPVIQYRGGVLPE